MRKCKNSFLQFYKKYSIKKDSVGILIFVSIILIIAYGILLRFSYSNTANYKNAIDFATTFLELSISISVTSIIATWIIEVNNKNSDFEKIVLNELFASKAFQNNLSEENKIRLLSSLGKDILSNEKEQEMFSYLCKKIKNFSNDGFYFEECAYNITCTIESDHFKKEVIKKIRLCSYEKTNLKNFLIFSQSFPPNGYGNLKNEDFSVVINNSEIDINNDLEKKEEPTKYMNDKIAGYTNSIDYIYNKNLEVFPGEEITIEVRRESIIPKSDINYICRLTHPCKNFTFNYRLKNKNKKYKVSAAAFGFNDDASRTPHQGRDESSVVANFDGWVFPQDGIVVTILKK